MNKQLSYEIQAFRHSKIRFRNFFFIITGVLLVFRGDIKNKTHDYSRILSEYANSLEQRLIKCFGNNFRELPPMLYNKRIHRNAVFRNDTIFIGRQFFTNPYLGYEERISVIYHEYCHYNCWKENLFPCKTDTTGNIYQVKTSIFYKNPPSPVELLNYYETFCESVTSVDEKELYHKMITDSAIVRFIYAPSNLAREEIFCYQSEIDASQKYKLFNTNNDYIRLLQYQIEMEVIYLKLGLKYENENNLKPNGNIQTKDRNESQ